MTFELLGPSLLHIIKKFIGMGLLVQVKVSPSPLNGWGLKWVDLDIIEYEKNVLFKKKKYFSLTTSVRICQGEFGI